MKIKFLKKYKNNSKTWAKGDEADVDRQTGKRLIKKKIAREFGISYLDEIVIKYRNISKNLKTKKR